MGADELREPAVAAGAAGAEQPGRPAGAADPAIAAPFVAAGAPRTAVAEQQPAGTAGTAGGAGYRAACAGSAGAAVADQPGSPAVTALLTERAGPAGPAVAEQPPAGRAV